MNTATTSLQTHLDGKTPPPNSICALPGLLAASSLNAKSSTGNESPTFPFRFQHQILTTLQSILEAACYRFSKTYYPEILEENKWTCPEAGELTEWTRQLIGHVKANPSKISSIIYNPSGFKFVPVLWKLKKLRNTTVNRNPLTGEDLKRFVNQAMAATEVLRYEEGTEEIEEIAAFLACYLRAAKEERSKAEIKQNLDEILSNVEELKEVVEKSQLVEKGTDETCESILEVQLDELMEKRWKRRIEKPWEEEDDLDDLDDDYPDDDYTDPYAECEYENHLEEEGEGEEYEGLEEEDEEEEEYPDQEFWVEEYSSPEDEDEQPEYPDYEMFEEEEEDHGSEELLEIDSAESTTPHKICSVCGNIVT